MKKNRILMSSFLMLLFLFFTSCKTKPSAYMMGFSGKVKKAIEKSDITQLKKFFGSSSDYGRLIKNMKTKQQQQRWKKSTEIGLERNLSRLIAALRQEKANINEIDLIHMVYKKPSQSSQKNIRKIGYFTVFPRGYIIFTYYSMPEKNERIVLSGLYYSKKKPSGQFDVKHQIASDYYTKKYEANQKESK